MPNTYLSHTVGAFSPGMKAQLPCQSRSGHGEIAAVSSLGHLSSVAGGQSGHKRDALTKAQIASAPVSAHTPNAPPLPGPSSSQSTPQMGNANLKRKATASEVTSPATASREVPTQNNAKRSTQRKRTKT